MAHAENSPKSIVTLDSSTTASELESHLNRADIPLVEWGQGAAKTVGHLLHEIHSGESGVSIDSERGTIERTVEVAWIDVLHLAKDGAVYALREARQEYADGRKRFRTTLLASLGEKMLQGEPPETAAFRALNEELGIPEPQSLHFRHTATELHTPDTYPGLQSEYQNHFFVATVSEESFNPEGYVEVQTDKINYYEWTVVRETET